MRVQASCLHGPCGAGRCSACGITAARKLRRRSPSLLVSEEHCTMIRPGWKGQSFVLSASRIRTVLASACSWCLSESANMMTCRADSTLTFCKSRIVHGLPCDKRERGDGVVHGKSHVRGALQRVPLGEALGNPHGKLAGQTWGTQKKTQHGETQ